MSVEEEKEGEQVKKKKKVKFDTKNPENTDLVLTTCKNHTFTWISKILCYSYKNKYLIVHDLMKGVSILNNHNDTFNFHHEGLSLTDESLILTSHCINTNMILAQDDSGVVYLVSPVKKKGKGQKIFALQERARYRLNERITCYFTLHKKDKRTASVWVGTVEGNIYTVKTLNNDICDFLVQLQYQVLKKRLENEELDSLLKRYERGFDRGFDGQIIQSVFEGKFIIYSYYKELYIYNILLFLLVVLLS